MAVDAAKYEKFLQDVVKWVLQARPLIELAFWAAEQENTPPKEFWTRLLEAPMEALIPLVEGDVAEALQNHIETMYQINDLVGGPHE